MMLNKKYKKVQQRAFFVGLFILVAIIWWTLLLHRMNKELYAAKKENVTLTISEKNKIDAALKKYDALEKRKSRMIWTESLSILIGIFVGLWFINRSYNKMIHSEFLKTNFALAISHELKSPLTAISLSFDMLKRKFKNDSSVNMIVDNGQKETRRLTRLINDILLGQSLESGYQVELSETQIPETIDKVVKHLTFQYPQANIQSRVHFEENVTLDKKAFYHSVLNLVENAIKYSGEKAEVTIDVKKDNQKLICMISDKGLGIAQKDIPFIFNKFFRAGDESIRKTKGTGLGLFIVKRLIEQNGGTVSYEQNVPKGSIFSFQLPIKT